MNTNLDLMQQIDMLSPWYWMKPALRDDPEFIAFLIDNEFLVEADMPGVPPILQRFLLRSDCI